MSLAVPGARAVGGSPQPISFERERGVYQTLVTHELAHAVVTVGSDSDRSDRIQQVLDRLTAQSIPIFLIKLHTSAITFAVETSFLEAAESCVREAGFAVRTTTGLALLTINASSMRDLSGVMVNIADSLQAAGARLFGVGDSHNSVQCLIDGRHVGAAVKKIGETFGFSEREEGQHA